MHRLPRFPAASASCSSAERPGRPLPAVQVIVGLVPERLKRSPNAKMFLRSFWFRASLKEVVHADEMHIYTLARCGGAGRGHGTGQRALRPLVWGDLVQR